MEFDEQSNFEFPLALNAPGPSNETEEGVDTPVALSVEACSAVRMYAPGLAQTDVDAAVVIFSLRCTQALDVRVAASLRIEHPSLH